MTVGEAVQRLAEFTKSLPDFRIYQENEIDRYDHIGAAIADAVLQAQRDYYSVVAPRTERILKRWPEAKTVSAVLECLKSVSPRDFLDWSDNASSSNYLAHRVRRFVEIFTLLSKSGVDTIGDLKQWLTVEEHSAKLSGIFGVGPKTTEYVKILVGYSRITEARRHTTESKHRRWRVLCTLSLVQLVKPEMSSPRLC
jgi:hypothetical protein